MKDKTWQRLSRESTFVLYAVIAIVVSALSVLAIGVGSAISLLATLLAIGLFVLAAAKVTRLDRPELTPFEKAKDPIEWLKACDPRQHFTSETASWEHLYEHITSRETYFYQREKDSSFRNGYDLIKDQMLSDMKSSGQFMAANYAAKSVDRSFLEQKFENSNELADKLDQLVEATISNDSIADDVDTSYIDDFLASIKDLQASKEIRSNA